MPPNDWDRIQSVFLSVADLPPEKQAGVLDTECGDDKGLRAEVESLLASDRRSAHSISVAIADEAALLAGDSSPDAEEASPGENDGTGQIGAYVRQAVFDMRDQE